MTKKKSEGGLFEGAEIISSYSRRQALEDGVLVDVTEAASEVGFGCPVAMTAASWGKTVKLTEAARAACNDERGRLHDVVWMLRCAVERPDADPTMIFYELDVVRDRKEAEKTRLKAVSGPGDDGEQVITLMLPEED